MIHHHSKKADAPVKILGLEKVEDEIKSKFYELREGKIWFSEESKREHRRLRSSGLGYILHSRFFVLISSPFIYACIVPFMLLDLFLSLYQAVCFPIYGIPKVRRGDYLAIDRKKLRYLNAIEGLNCTYCSYANGLLAYAVEIVGRTEQHWCPIKHARRTRHPHDRYSHFLPYGDAVSYRERIEKVRNDFKDLQEG